MAGGTFHYFAYGSNMLGRRLRASNRAPSARVIATGYLDGFRLTFDKASTDGSGKCDAEETGSASDRVHGVVFEVERNDEAALDAVEGVKYGYRKGRVLVTAPTGVFDCATYLATAKEAALRPYHWYKQLVVAGAVENDLPVPYVEWLRSVESMEDSDERRRAANEAILGAS